MTSTNMSLQVIDYLESYNLQCARRNAYAIPFLQHLLTKCIDDGQIPSEFKLRGNHVELKEHRLTDDYLEIIIIPFAGKDFLVALDLSYNQITDKGGAILAKWLRTTQTLQKLVLASNNLGPGAGSVLAESLTVNTTLTTLDLSHNSLGNEGGMAIAGALQVNTTLTCLRVSRCDMSLPALIALCTVLHHNRTLRSLDISDNSGGVQHRAPSLHSDFVRHLSHMLAANKSLVELSLAKLGIDDYDMAQHLGPALTAATSLESLDLSSNRIMQDGATVMAATLISHPSLQSVRLSHNTLTSLGLGALVRMLKDNTVLTSLYLDYIGAGSDALLALAHVLLGLNKTIKRLAIWGNEFHDATPTGMLIPESAVAGSGAGNGCTCDVWDKLVSTHKRLEPANLDVCFYVVEGEWDVAKNERFAG